MEAISLVVIAVGSQFYIHGTILTRIEIFSFGLVASSMFLRAFYIYACLVATIKLKNLETYFMRVWSVNVKFSSFDGGEKGG